MNYALIIAIIISFPCALLSVFLVLKGWALIGDAMSHAMFPGIVLVWIIGMPLGIGAFIVGLSCAIATGYLKDNSIIKKDTIIGIGFFRNFCLDYQQAQVSGLQISLLHYGLLCMVSPTIFATLKAVGIILSIYY